MKQPKILVGCPTYWGKGYCLKEYAERVEKLSYPNYEVLLVDNSPDDRYVDKVKKEGLPVVKGAWNEEARERIVTSRNILREKVLEGYDYFLSLEQDIIPPENVIEQLLRHEKEIVTGIYNKEGTLPDGRKTSYALLYVEQQGKLVLVHPERLKSQELIKINACGLGCILIHRKVLEKIRFRKPTHGGSAQDDMMFCYDAQKAGFELFVDTSVVCEHLHKDWKEAEEETKSKG